MGSHPDCSNTDGRDVDRSTSGMLIMKENEKVKALVNDEDIDYYKTMFRWVEEMSNPANLHVCFYYYSSSYNIVIGIRAIIISTVIAIVIVL